MKWIKRCSATRVIFCLTQVLSSASEAQWPQPYEASYIVSVLFAGDSKDIGLLSKSESEIVSQNLFDTPFDHSWRSVIGNAALKVDNDHFELTHRGTLTLPEPFPLELHSTENRISSISDLSGLLCANNSALDIATRKASSLILWICFPLSDISVHGKPKMIQSVKISQSLDKESRVVFIDKLNQDANRLNAGVYEITGQERRDISYTKKDISKLNMLLFPSECLSGDLLTRTFLPSETLLLYNGFFSNDFIPAHPLRTWKLVNIPAENGDLETQTVRQHFFDFAYDESIAYNRYSPVSLSCETFAEGRFKGQLYNTKICFSLETDLSHSPDSSIICIDYSLNFYTKKKKIKAPEACRKRALISEACYGTTSKRPELMDAAHMVHLPSELTAH